VVRVVKTGFSDEISNSEHFPSCGIELRNVSNSDARNLIVTVEWLDANGHSISTIRNGLALIPARRTFYMSCFQSDGLTVAVASLRVKVNIGKSTAHATKLPPVSNLKLTSDECGSSPAGTEKPVTLWNPQLLPQKCGGRTLAGTLNNPYKIRFSPDAVIYVVFYSANGNIVGGQQDDSTAVSLRPGATIPFSFSDLHRDIAKAEVSVDPCGVDAFAGDCRLP